MENGPGANHYEFECIKEAARIVRITMPATNTGTTTNEEQTAMIPVEDLFFAPRALVLLRESSTGARASRSDGAIQRLSRWIHHLTSAIWIFSFFSRSHGNSNIFCVHDHSGGDRRGTVFRVELCIPAQMLRFVFRRKRLRNVRVSLLHFVPIIAARKATTTVNDAIPDLQARKLFVP